MALVLVTHNMGVVAEMARRVAVMYAGQVMEERESDALFASPQHPYTAALLAAMPERNTGDDRLATIPGVVPGPHDRPVEGDALHGQDRTAFVDVEQPGLITVGATRTYLLVGDADSDSAGTHDLVESSLLELLRRDVGEVQRQVVGEHRDGHAVGRALTTQEHDVGVDGNAQRRCRGSVG